MNAPVFLAIPAFSGLTRQDDAIIATIFCRPLWWWQGTFSGESVLCQETGFVDRCFRTYSSQAWQAVGKVDFDADGGRFHAGEGAAAQDGETHGTPDECWTGQMVRRRRSASLSLANRARTRRKGPGRNVLRINFI
jgi:hypothetical protein